MSDLKPGPCLVCGVVTKNRCSNCAKSGISLMFCSPSHQKLVWFAHKQFCGPGKAHPFAWPLLSEDEAREAMAHKSSDIRDHCGKALVQYMPGVPLGDIDDLIRQLTVPGPAPLDPVLASVYLVTIRCVEYMRLAHDGQFQSANREGDILRRVAGFHQMLAFANLLKVASKPSSSLILHQHVVHQALSDAADRSANAGRLDLDLNQLAIDSVVRLRKLVPDEPAMPFQARIGIDKMEETLVRDRRHAGHV
ncbi:hypothetical protein JCM8208_000127 [Rhodotorula glutinis]